MVCVHILFGDVFGLELEFLCIMTVCVVICSGVDITYAVWMCVCDDVHIHIRVYVCLMIVEVVFIMCLITLVFCDTVCFQHQHLTGG